MGSVSLADCRAIVCGLTVLVFVGCATTNISPTRQPETSATFLEVTRILEHSFWSADRLNPQALLKGAVEGIAPGLSRREAAIGFRDDAIVIALSGHTKAINLASVNTMTAFIEAFIDIHHFLLQRTNGQATDWEYRAIEGMIKALDKNSRLIPATEFREMQGEARGSLGGIGLRLRLKDGELVLVETFDEAPASRAGLREGDRLITIDGHPTQGLSLDDAVRLLRGHVGSRIVLRIMREGSSAPEEVPLIRDRVVMKTVDSRLLDERVGYLKVRGFHETTLQETENALSRLTQQKIEGLILDLRDNPGGLLSQSIKVCNLFVSEGLIVASTKGRVRNQNSRFVASGGGQYRHYPLIVLINWGSAAGSEIVAGALQDLQKATIIGTKSYGRGSIQTIFPLGDGSGLSLTTAHFFPPSGRNIDGTGITPDIEIANSGKEDRQLATAQTIMQETLIITHRDEPFGARQAGPISTGVIKEVARRMGLL